MTHANYLSQLVEIYKARMTIGLSLLLGMVTVTGYGVSAQRPDLFLVAALIPLVAFVFDMALLCKLAVPFAYRAFVVDEQDPGPESMGMLFVAFAGKAQGALGRFRLMESGIERQRAFLRVYALRSIYLKVAVTVLGVLGEVVLWLLFRA